MCVDPDLEKAGQDMSSERGSQYASTKSAEVEVLHLQEECLSNKLSDNDCRLKYFYDENGQLQYAPTITCSKLISDCKQITMRIFHKTERI